MILHDPVHESSTHASTVSDHTFPNPLSPLHIAFFDLYSDPQDISAWSGIPASVIQGLRAAGQHVTVTGRVLPLLRRALSSLRWHYYQRVRHLHYMPDRDKAITRLFSFLAAPSVARACASSDVVLTTCTTAAGYLKTEKPIFVIFDATWSQVVDEYPYFHPSLQVPHVVRSGFEMEKLTFTRENVTLIATSAWAGDAAVNAWGLDREKIFILPFGPNFSQDPPLDLAEQAIHARTGEHCHLLFVGTEFERKGGDIAVETARQLREQGIPTTLHIVGCSPVGLPSWVVVHGFLRKSDSAQAQQLQRLYRESDFFILPTRAEAQGVVFIEAAAFGLPVAATDVGGVSAVVADGDWGNLEGLEDDGTRQAAWIASLFRDRARYASVARSARRDFDTRLSRAKYTENLISILRTVVSRKTAKSLPE
jgi:glycosyltransferase involved in cell wall biosynthesis